MRGSVLWIFTFTPLDLPIWMKTAGGLLQGSDWLTAEAVLPMDAVALQLHGKTGQRCI